MFVSHLHPHDLDTLAMAMQARRFEPGDVISTGTPGGVAGVMKPPKWLVPGDKIRVEIEGLDSIENTVIQEPAETTLI